MSVNLDRNKKIIIAIIALIIIGLGVYLVTKGGNDNKNNDQAAQTSQSSGTSQKASSSVFSPAPTAKSSFTATLDTTTNGKKTSIILKFDGKGNTAISYGEGASKVEITYTKDTYYMCSGANTCYKYPIKNLASSGFDPSNYQYSSSTINDLKTGAKYDGKKSCPAGDCYVWSTTQGSTDLKVYIDTKTNRISQVEGTADKVTYKYIYDYKTSVSITPPANAKAAPSY